MFSRKISKTQKLALAGLFMAMYVLVMLYTQSFAFGQYQIRIATSLYALSAVFPFLVVPLGLANFISNTLMGGLGPLDMLGGALVGFGTGASIVWVKKQQLSNWFIAVLITLVPGLMVPVWLSILLGIPYLILMPAIAIGQIVPGIVGTLLVIALERNKQMAKYEADAVLSKN